MRQSQVILLKSACWVTVGAFAGMSGLFGIEMRQILAENARPGSLGLFCGNSVTDPLELLLGLGSPIGFAAIVPLVDLWRRGLATGRSVIPPALVVFTCTAMLLLFGIRFFREYLGSVPLSNLVWWMPSVVR